MKKVILIVVLLLFLGACLIAGVGGFFWYRMHKLHQAGEEGRPGGFLSWLKKEPPSETPPATEAQPEPQPQAQPEAQPEPQPEPQVTPSPEVSPPPAPQPSEPAPSQIKERGKPRTQPAPKSAPSQTPEPAPQEESQPDYASPSSSEPPPASPPVQERAEPAPRVKTPKGTLGIIFETEAEGGDVLLHVDEQLVEKRTFRASSQQRFRLTKNVPLPVGAHKVRITVVKPDGKTVGKEWQVDVSLGGNPVWKVELSSSARALDLKEIQPK